VAKDEGWPSDLATESFLEGKQALANEDDFGDDTPGLGVELDWDYVKAHPYQALNLRTFHDRDNALPLI
jgi:hypothetical protein